MEVGEEFGIKVHALVTVQETEYLADKEEYAHLLPLICLRSSIVCSTITA
ncbi:MAG: hypothetical protein ACLRIO_07620 [Butyricicoccus sp.]